MPGDGSTMGSDDGSGVGEIRFEQRMYSMCDGSVLSCSAILPTPSPSGDALIVTVTYDNTATQVSELTDDAGNSYTRLIPATTWPSYPYRTESWYGISNGAANPITLTATFSTLPSTFSTVYVDEYSGANPTAPIDQVAVMSGLAPATDFSSGLKTIKTPRELIFGHGEGQGGPILPGPGFMTRGTDFGNIEEDRFVTSTGSYDARFDANGALAWFAVMITIR